MKKVDLSVAEMAYYDALNERSMPMLVCCGAIVATNYSPVVVLAVTMHAAWYFIHVLSTHRKKASMDLFPIQTPVPYVAWYLMPFFLFLSLLIYAVLGSLDERIRF